jgi:hypothetical protein
MRNALFLTVVILFAVALALACTSTPTTAPMPAAGPLPSEAGNNAAPRPAAAAGGSAFSSPIETPPSPIATPLPGATATPEKPASPVEMSIALAGPVIPGQPVTVNIDILAREGLSSPAFGVGLGNDAKQQVYTATLPSFAPNELRHFSYTFLVPAVDGLYGAGASLTDNGSGATYVVGISSFAVTHGTFVPNPTPWPDGVSVPLAPPKVTALPTPTPQATAAPTAAGSSGGPPASGLPPDGDRAQAPSRIAALVTISGRVTISARPHLLNSPDPMPGKYMKVSVYDLNNPSTGAGEPPDVLLGQTVTDANGNWHIANISDVDTGNDGTHPDVYVICESTNNAQGSLLRTVRSDNNTLYRWDTKSDPQWDWVATSPVYERLIDINKANIRAAWLFDDANRAHDFWLQKTGHEPGQVHIYWANNMQNLNGCSTSCFGPVSGSPNGFGAFVQDFGTLGVVMPMWPFTKLPMHTGIT